jgi:hypothetical protein
MVTLLITALAIFAIFGIGLYFWQKSVPDYSENLLPPRPEARGLFTEDSSTLAEDKEQLAIDAGQRAQSLIARARNGERPALDEAHRSGDNDLYDQVLNELVERSDSDPKLLSLMSYVTQNELPVNTNLAKAVIKSWKRTPDRSGTAKALHFAALSNDADIYREAVESALGFWREGKLADISALELRALFDGEFWVLSSRTRSSGTGFVLKRTLASTRRELEAAESEARA